MSKWVASLYILQFWHHRYSRQLVSLPHHILQHCSILHTFLIGRHALSCCTSLFPLSSNEVQPSLYLSWNPKLTSQFVAHLNAFNIKIYIYRNRLTHGTSNLVWSILAKPTFTHRRHVQGQFTVQRLGTCWNQT